MHFVFKCNESEACVASDDQISKKLYIEVVQPDPGRGLADAADGHRAIREDLDVLWSNAWPLAP